MYEDYPSIVETIRAYILESFKLQNAEKCKRGKPNEEMVYGCLKLLSETFVDKIFNDYSQILTYLIENYIETVGGKGAEK
jgi:hypothetical protein